jgi:hypothetical protein
MLILFKKNTLELLFFIAALVFLFFLDINQTHFTLCPLAAMGFNFCLGCGLGHSIYYLMHLNFIQSWESHHLGFFAFIVIIHRIYTLTKNKFKGLKPIKHEY